MQAVTLLQWHNFCVQELLVTAVIHNFKLRLSLFCSCREKLPSNGYKTDRNHSPSAKAWFPVTTRQRTAKKAKVLGRTAILDLFRTNKNKKKQSNIQTLRRIPQIGHTQPINETLPAPLFTSTRTHSTLFSGGWTFAGRSLPSLRRPEFRSHNRRSSRSQRLTHARSQLRDEEGDDDCYSWSVRGRLTRASLARTARTRTGVATPPP